MEFHEGDKVEACSEQEGFLGSYYTATVEDMSKLLIETVSDGEVRPVPPRIKFGRGFSVFDKLDVSDNDGVAGRQGYRTKRASVFYHLDWANGKWVSSKKMVS
ncbi:DUF724 domain-containing protein [Salix suchowensis]|nr:DUF724 domain-containing protein [Salix suchowensis]